MPVPIAVIRNECSIGSVGFAPTKAFETRELPPALRSNEIIPLDDKTLEKIARYVSRDVDEDGDAVVKSGLGYCQLPIMTNGAQ